MYTRTLAQVKRDIKYVKAEIKTWPAILVKLEKELIKLKGKK